MKRLLPALSLIVLSSCSTIANGPMQRVRVESDPQGAVVRLRRCGAMATRTLTTPGVAWVSRRSTQCELTFAMPERAEQRMKLSRHVSRNMALYGTTADVILDGSDSFSEWIFAATIVLVPSFVVDLASGAMFEQVPSEAYADFTKREKDWRDR